MRSRAGMPVAERAGMRKSISLVSTLMCLGSAAAFADSSKKLDVTSSDFKDSEALPSEYTCDGANKIPELSWSTVPSEAKSIAILVDDTDAPKSPYTHLLITGISPTMTSVAEGGPLPSDANVVSNDRGLRGYTGPCPTNASTHHYHFRVYALDTTLSDVTGRTAFMRVMKGHVIAQGELVGTYKSRSMGSDH
jgi:Raf kinase inhibitor-like YbhB/YbcL family protein